MSPRVSVVLAAYNRSAVLRCAIESVLRQTFGDWDLIVVCDACTDDSEQVAAAFGDPRISSVNLAQNHGDQSEANNEGFRRAQGDIIAHLNQDDLWFPDHLEKALAALDESRADMVFTLAARIRPDRKELTGVAPGGRFSRYVFAPASTLMFRRETLEAVGGWRHYRQSHRHPTQDLLLRFQRAGKDMRLVPHVTVVAIPAGLRPGSYRGENDSENESYLSRMSDPHALRAELLEEIALGYATPMLHDSGLRMTARGAVRIARDAITAAGLDAWTLEQIAKYGPRRGSLVDFRLRFKGLAPRRERRV